MALYDSADLLVRCRDSAQLPEDDESMTDPKWFRLLTDAQLRWMTVMAGIVPEPLYGTPERLASTDGGRTYTFGLDEGGRAVIPLGLVQLFRQESDAFRPEGPAAYALVPGVHFQTMGDRIVLPDTGRLTFPDGAPWARYIEPPGVIDATHEPVLLPILARPLLVADAVEAWATQGGLHDPTPYQGRAAALWAGDRRGDIGILGTLRTQYFRQTAPAGRGAVRTFGRVPVWAQGWPR